MVVKHQSFLGGPMGRRDESLGSVTLWMGKSKRPSEARFLLINPYVWSAP